MRQFLRNIHPLCWFLLIGSMSNWVWEFLVLRRQYQDLIGSALFILLFIIPHTILYWFGFTFRMRRSLQWLLLASQIGFILTVAQVSHDGIAVFILSLVFCVAAFEILQVPGLVLLATGGYLVSMLLYAYTLGSQIIPWFFLWRGDNFVIEIPVLLILSGITIFLQQKRAHAKTQALLHELHTAHAQLSAYALRMEELTMITERQRLARELHDTLTQGVAGLLMQLEAANAYLGKGQTERGQEIILASMMRARTVLTETRYVLQDLRADTPRSDDLVEMVQEEIDHFTERTGIPCEAALNALAATPDTQGGHIVRIIAEGLANVARHAQAQQVWVCTNEQEAVLTIEVRDDGIGFDPLVAPARPGHYGLAGLRERVRLIGGHLDVLSSPGGGTSLHVRVPLNDARRCA